MIFQGWVFDADLHSEGIRLWVIDPEGRRGTFIDRWAPFFYFSGPVRSLQRAGDLLRRCGARVVVDRVEREELFSHRSLPVLRATVWNPRSYSRIVEQLEEIKGLLLYNSDIPLVELYYYERGHFPLALCQWEVDAQGLVRDFELLDSPWTIDYRLPPLRFAHLGWEGEGSTPHHVSSRSLLLTLGQEPGRGEAYLLEGSDWEQIETFSKILRRWDPDVLVTDWGDSYLLPRMLQIGAASRRELPLSRDSSQLVIDSPSRSYETYGKVVYRGGPKYLVGRWHLDRKNSFLLQETGLDGLLEVARIARMPVQRAARATIGTSVSSLQLYQAFREGILIPREKQQVEDFREAGSLIAADRGGLVYLPDVGWYEGVVEYDFVSLYPSLMVRNNISPETVNCSCCPQARAPGIGHHLCQKRKGLIPKVLEPILQKRALYKRRYQAECSAPASLLYKRRYTAHKWILVCCFGYLGFKNARFGRIEAHECVNAYGREVLLQAKEIAEGFGFRFLHALVDSLWLKKEGATEEEYRTLAREIERGTGVSVGIEGVYRWLRFCPSRTDDHLGVPSRYFGLFQHGELKVRGIELRRHDTPPLVRRMQEELLEKMAECSSLEELKGGFSQLLDIVERYRARLSQGKVEPSDLAIRSRLSRGVDDYVHDTLAAIAAKKLLSAGVPLHPGEMIEYIVCSVRNRVKDWRVTPLAFINGHFEYDIPYYLKLLERAAGSLLSGLKLSPFDEGPLNEGYWRGERGGGDV